MYSKQYLLYGGFILFGLGLLGLIGVLGPGISDSIFGSAWFFSSGQSWVNLVLGIIAFVLAYSLETEARRWIAGIYSVLALITGLFALLLPTDFSTLMGADSGSAVSAIFYLAFGAWGAWTMMSAIETPSMHGPATPMPR